MKPNIILITSDQLRPFELGCYGGTVVTPNIDRLAARGAVWETAITNFPVCMAARSVLISGQHNRTATGGRTNVAYPGRPGDFNMPEYPYPRRPHLPDATLAEGLRAAGYRTAVIGKWHIHSWPHEIGFDHYTIPRVHHAHSAQIYSRDGGPEFAPGGWSVDFEASEAENHIAAHAGGDPFFLYYNISPPHCPVADLPDEFLTMYDPANVVLRENTDAARINDRDYWYKVYRWDFRHYSFRLPHTMDLPPGYDIRHLAAEYFGAVTWMDRAVGRILDAVTKAGIEEDTLIVFASDHGENLGSHGLVQKGSPNDESLRIPLVMAGPGVVPGHRIDRSVASLVDLAPTLLDAAGQGTPAHMQGASLMAEAVGGCDARTAFFETTDGVGLRSPVATIFAPLDGRAMAAPNLFHDNTADPFQYRNIMDDRHDDPLVAELAARNAQIPWSDLKDDT
ncbi:sulfatase-like hydrolase/transferase [Jannaschia donghaensis]|uniref:Arylsulfatase n=1 Tax=Jannaschia donghaensis TaxID=420998 RepID=A0A0M6YNK7_9RHOB|nr:sulfatase-like hydrolase/transferase [Jannaschia donghaensis]CTQ51464.1 Arylsulfatase [Jannaschia donghaensis]